MGPNFHCVHGDSSLHHHISRLSSLSPSHRSSSTTTNSLPVLIEMHAREKPCLCSSTTTPTAPQSAIPQAPLTGRSSQGCMKPAGRLVHYTALTHFSPVHLYAKERPRHSSMAYLHDTALPSTLSLHHSRLSGALFSASHLHFPDTGCAAAISAYGDNALAECNATTREVYIKC